MTLTERAEGEGCGAEELTLQGIMVRVCACVPASEKGEGRAVRWSPLLTLWVKTLMQRLTID